jgi:hypothetical protein
MIGSISCERKFLPWEIVENVSALGSRCDAGAAPPL